MEPRRYVLGIAAVRRIGFGAMQLPVVKARDEGLIGGLGLRPNVLLIAGTSSVRHLEENMAVADIELDAQARELLASMA